MLLNCDNFFIQELQNSGYDIDYKKIIEIYKISRQSDGYKRRKTKQAREEKEMSEFAENMGFYD